MRRTSIAIALTTLMLASLCIAQQATSSPSANSDRSGSPTPPPGPIIGGMGTTNYIPIWASSSFLMDSVIYQNSGGNVGVGTTVPVAKLDVNGNVNSAGAYQIGGTTMLSYPSPSNLFIGPDAGNGNSGLANNVFVGGDAGHSNSASDNTFVGSCAGSGNTSGSSNAFFGWCAGYSNTIGQQNTFLGALAGTYNTAGVYDTFVGASAGQNNTTGFDDTFVGINAGLANTTGGNNSFFGQGTGFSNTTGNLNSYFGNAAGSSNSTGSSNTFFGALAGNNSTTGNNNIYIANLGCPYPCTESGTIRIGGDLGHGYGPQTAVYVAGIYGATSSSGVPVYVNAFGQLGTSPSSIRFKQQVRDMGDSTSALMSLRPVTFLYKPEYSKGDRTLQYGLIAEEVSKVYPELVAYDNDGQPYTVRYQYLSTMLLNEAQKQYRRAQAQAEVITTQEQKIDSQQRQIEEMQQRLSRLEALVGTRVNTAQADTEHDTIGGSGAQ